MTGVPQWPTASSISSFKYMMIGNENGNSESLFQLKENYFIERSEFWMNLRDRFKLNSWETGNSAVLRISSTFIVILLAILKILC
jgi:hypothetical protein